MTDSSPRNYVHAEVLGGGQRPRRWTPEEKLRMVEETFLPGNSVSRVARMHGVVQAKHLGQVEAFGTRERRVCSRREAHPEKANDPG